MDLGGENHPDLTIEVIANQCHGKIVYFSCSSQTFGEAKDSLLKRAQPSRRMLSLTLSEGALVFFQCS